MTDSEALDLSALTKLLEMIDGDADDLAEFVGDFSEIAPTLVSDMKTALADQDWDKMRIASHTLKSNARDMGALHLSDLSAAIERAVKADPSGIQPDQIAEIEAQSVAAVAALGAVTFEAVAP